MTTSAIHQSTAFSCYTSSNNPRIHGNHILEWKSNDFERLIYNSYSSRKSRGIEQKSQIFAQETDSQNIKIFQQVYISRLWVLFTTSQVKTMAARWQPLLSEKKDQKMRKWIPPQKKGTKLLPLPCNDKVSFHRRVVSLPSAFIRATGRLVRQPNIGRHQKMVETFCKEECQIHVWLGRRDFISGIAKFRGLGTTIRSSWESEKRLWRIARKLTLFGGGLFHVLTSALFLLLS